MPLGHESIIGRYRRRLATVGAAVRAGRHRSAHAPQPPDYDGRGLRELIAEVAEDAYLVDIPVNRAPWRETPLSVQAGDSVTWLSWGTVYLIKPLAVSVTPSLGLIGKVSNGKICFSSTNTFTLTADDDGLVQFAGRFPAWMNQHGELETDRLPYRAMRGRLRVVVAKWPKGVDPANALESVAARDSTGLCATEVARLRQTPRPPEGWDNHPSTGAEQIARRGDHGIVVECHGTGGIICRPADVSLTDRLRLRWSWRIDDLPTKLPEDTLLTHDYLSIALEFDDGQDLTWYWSSSLPEGYSYRCPMDFWRKRETHIVTRSGSDKLGTWVEEDRPVAEDHAFAIGGPTPRRVVRAWLIACCLHQGQTARGEFRNVELVDGDNVIRLI